MRVRLKGIKQDVRGRTIYDMQFVNASDVVDADYLDVTDDNSLVLGDRYVDLVELSADPAAPAANGGRLYLKDNGSGKTLLCVRFASGAVQTVATQP